MKLPSDAQADALGWVAQKIEEVGTLWIRTEAPPDESCQQTWFLHEVVDRENDTACFNRIWTYTGREARRLGPRTTNACIRHGWLALSHPTMFAAGVPLDYGTRIEGETIHQVELTEDGVIARGRWVQRKLSAPPAPSPVLEGVEREMVDVAARAGRLGCVVLPLTNEARQHARHMTRRGWVVRGWGGSSTMSFRPTNVGRVEVEPEGADEPAPERNRWL